MNLTWVFLDIFMTLSPVIINASYFGGSILFEFVLVTISNGGGWCCGGGKGESTLWNKTWGQFPSSASLSCTLFFIEGSKRIVNSI